MQSVSIYIAVLTCDFRRNDNIRRRCHVYENEEIKSSPRGTCGILRARRIPFGAFHDHFHDGRDESFPSTSRSP